MSLPKCQIICLIATLLGCRAPASTVGNLKDLESSVSSASIPIIKVESVNWSSRNGNIYLNDQIFHLKGVNWFGLDTPATWLFGLEHRSLESILDLLVQYNINSIRVPLSVKSSLDLQFVPPQQNFKNDPDLIGKPWIQTLHKLLAESAKRGITIMLDMHTITPGDNLATGLWYTNDYSKLDFRQAWKNILNEFGNYWNIWGLDLKNELHQATWGANKESDWNREIETLVPLLSGAAPHYKGLFVVQGIWHETIGEHKFGAFHDAENNRVVVTDASGYGAPHFWDFWWGGNLLGIKDYPLQLPSHLDERIAYTVHFYGPAVWPLWYYNDPTQMANGLGVYQNPEQLDQVLDLQHTFIEKNTNRALIIGEWGGRNGKITRNSGGNTPMITYDDSVIINRVAYWFARHCMADAMWWAINPESGDTGGLLKPGYQEIEEGKFAVMAQMMPNPTKLAYSPNKGEIEIRNPGNFHPEANCQR